MAYNKEATRKYNESDKGKVAIKRSMRKQQEKKFGIPPGTYETLLAKQNGLCAICEKKSHLRLDHNHRTGEVRKFLCVKCNTLLGDCKESPEILRRALVYVNK